MNCAKQTVESSEQPAVESIAQDEQVRVEDCQEAIWKIRSEMEGIGALLTSIGDGAEVSADELFGVGTWIKRLGSSLHILEDQLGVIGRRA